MSDLNDQIQTWLQEKKPLIGLDFDGTLVGINADPEVVRLSNEAAEVIEFLARKYECALISGRMISDLRSRAPLANVHYIGTHGAEIEKRDGGNWRFQDKTWEHWRALHWKAFELWVSEHGGRIEDKGISFSIHFRESSWWTTLGVTELRRRFKDFADVLDGINAWNITPSGSPHKGHSAELLCRQLGCDSLIYFGDEQTDENVFKLSSFPVLGVKVGAGQTAAAWRVDGPHEVVALLKQLA